MLQGSILQYFDLHKLIIGIENQFLVFSLGGRLRQVLLYLQCILQYFWPT